jgi:hypothetical protein
MTPFHHAQSSAARHGGRAEDYLAIHQFFDETKAFLPDFRHRALRHHAEGIFLAERLLGVTVVNSSGRHVPVRLVGEEHVKEDLGRIPTAQDWLACLQPAAWMTVRSRPLSAATVDQCSPASPGDLYRVSWEIDVHADSPREAAQRALEIQGRRDSIATVFQVVGSDGTVHTIDLLADA